VTKSTAAQVLSSLVRDVPDFPAAGVTFKDITPVLGDASALAVVVAALSTPFVGQVDKVAMLEARGFILGTPVALALGVGVIPLRKPGKLPWLTYKAEYSLEYGTDSIEMHQDAVSPGERVLIVDDVIATGGTARAAISLIERAGGVVVGVAALLEVPELGGRSLLGDVKVHVVSA
jgi:adenine phosphoribosyltransferase